MKEVLKLKHLKLRVPNISFMEKYDTLPDLVEIDITADTVESLAWQLSGSAGPGGTNASGLQHWLLRFGGASAEFRKAAAELVKWKLNNNSPWATYQACPSSRVPCRLNQDSRCLTSENWRDP